MRTCRDFADRIDSSPEKFRGFFFAGELVDSPSVETCGRSRASRVFFFSLSRRDCYSVNVRRRLNGDAERLSGKHVISIACIPADTNLSRASLQSTGISQHLAPPVGRALFAKQNASNRSDFGAERVRSGPATVGGLRGNRFPSLEVSIDPSILPPLLSPSVLPLFAFFLDRETAPGLSFSRWYLSVSVSWLSRSLSRAAWLLYCVSLSR